MLYLLGKHYSGNFLRLFGSHIVLLSIGLLATGLLTALLLPRFMAFLPRDRGKAIVPQGASSAGKPTGAGLPMALVMLPVILLVTPPDWSVCGVVMSLYAIMYTGYKDDASDVPWGQLKKGLLDLACALTAAFFISRGGAMDVWLPFTTRVLTVPFWLYLPVAAFVIWLSVNAMNCSDGVDGVAGSLGLISLLSLAALLYLVLGYAPVASYLLLPHYPDSAKWAILASTLAGSLAGYLWHNAEPSSVLMGDAGSRMLGMMIGVAVLASGNPLLLVVVAPVILVNGGTGLVKILLLRFLRRLGFDTTPPPAGGGGASAARGRQPLLIRGMHSVRFPLHDHCRKVLGWRNPQVLMRFVLIQAFLIPLLFALFIKVR